MQDVQNVFPFLINKIRNMKLYVQLETAITKIQCFFETRCKSSQNKKPKKKKKKKKKKKNRFEVGMLL
jgi:hypothetical protein